MERKIGEIFEYKGKNIEVAMAEMDCNGCFFKNMQCWNLSTIKTGQCEDVYRSDKTNVIFKEVTKVAHINDITDPEFPEPQMDYEQ